MVSLLFLGFLLVLCLGFLLLLPLVILQVKVNVHVCQTIIHPTTNIPYDPAQHQQNHSKFGVVKGPVTIITAITTRSHFAGR